MVLFFDGECILCNGAVRWILERNTSGDIRFASLQGNYAKKMLGYGVEDSMVFMEGDRVFTRSAAVFEILRYLPAWRWMRVLRFIPRRITDGIYKWVARNRFRWFGKQEVCRVLPPGYSERLISD